MRAAVFIDGSNFYYACRASLGRTDVDLGKFSQWLVGGRELVRIYYYNCPVPADALPETKLGQERFFGALAHVPYLEVRLGKLAPKDFFCRTCNTTRVRYVEKGVD